MDCLVGQSVGSCIPETLVLSAAATRCEHAGTRLVDVRSPPGRLAARQHAGATLGPIVTGSTSDLLATTATDKRNLMLEKLVEEICTTPTVFETTFAIPAILLVIALIVPIVILRPVLVMISVLLSLPCAIEVLLSTICLLIVCTLALLPLGT